MTTLLLAQSWKYCGIVLKPVGEDIEKMFAKA